MLGANKRVLMIAAHPDDEDTELLTVLGRGLGARAAYLSLNRGEGGQNLIGDELGEALGLLRTEELLAARQLDGAGQYFTRAYDFGFSKTLEDTWAHWPRDSVLKDVVRVIRRFRPQIVVSIFSGTPRDGHGQHQAAGWAAQEAFRIAGDSTRFPELYGEEGLPPWTPLKLYRSTRFDTTATTLTMDGGVIDPAVGQSYHQIAMRGRSLHRSQDMGQLQGIGPSAVRLQLVQDRTGRGQDALFAGIDTTLGSSWFGGDDPARRQWLAAVRRYGQLVDSARRSPRDGVIQAPILRAARAVLNEGQRVRAVPLGFAEDPVAEQLDRLAGMVQRAEGLVFDAVADDDRVAPGQPVTTTMTVWNAGSDTIEITRMPVAEDDHNGEKANAILAPGGVLRWTDVRAWTDTTSWTPYFLRYPRAGDMYVWPYSDQQIDPPRGMNFRAFQALPPGFGWKGQPLAGDPGAVLRFRLAGSGEDGWMVARRELAWRTNDQARGEIRRPVQLVPRVDVRLDPANEVWRAGAVAPQHFTVTIRHGARDTTMGTVSLELPPGWAPVPAQKFTLTRQEEEQEFRFTVTPPALRGGSFEVRAVATDLNRHRYQVGVVEVNYPHIHPVTYARNAVATVHVAPLALPSLARIGYVRGAADRVPEALESVGLPVELITGQDLATRPLNRYSVIVIGPRAWETDAALPGANDRLLDYARAGGTVIVQYQQYGYFLGNYAPYLLTVGSRQPGGTAVTVTSRNATQGPAGTALLGGHDRVTDETAPVTILDPRHPLVLTPNRLGPDDWKGWVQERGLYFARSWDPAWKSVFEMHDPGETPLEGGLLISRVGRGTYVYTGIAFFRQLPAGVPGAYRLFANLLALGRGMPR